MIRVGARVAEETQPIPSVKDITIMSRSLNQPTRDSALNAAIALRIAPLIRTRQAARLSLKEITLIVTK